MPDGLLAVAVCALDYLINMLHRRLSPEQFCVKSGPDARLGLEGVN
jgi:hypothetical protein